MAAEITNYQCPNCGGPLRFDAKKQKLVCDHCGSEYTVDEITEMFEAQNEAAIEAAHNAEDQIEMMQWSDEEASSMRAYNCPSCGAQLITDATTAASQCPYCGNPQVIPTQFSGSLKPDLLIPFKLEKQDAINRLQEFYKGKPFLPKKFKEENHIEEIKGMYVPFWLYDATAYAKLRYHGTTVHTYTRGDDQITETSHYSISRQGTVGFEKIPADASTKMPDDLMDSIEPYDYRAFVPFEMSYMPGYLADRYDVESEEDAKRVNLRIRNTTISKVKSSIIRPYATLIPEQEDVRIMPGTVHYAFMPVWLLSTQYNGQNYLFACNGQTGKMSGDTLPVDYVKFFVTFILIAVIGIVILYFALETAG